MSVRRDVLGSHGARKMAAARKIVCQICRFLEKAISKTCLCGDFIFVTAKSNVLQLIVSKNGGGTYNRLPNVQIFRKEIKNQTFLSAVGFPYS